LAFKIPYIYDFITQLCKEQAEVIQNHKTANFSNTGQGKVMHRKYKMLKVGSGEAYDRSSD